MLAFLLAACLPHPAPIPVGPVPEDAAVIAIVGPTTGDEHVAPILAEVDLVVLLQPVPLRRTLRQWEPATIAGVPILPVVGVDVARWDRGLRRFTKAFPGALPYGAADVAGARLVWLDSSGHRTRRVAQMYWLPRPLGDDVRKLVFLDPGRDAPLLIPAVHDYEPAGEPTLAMFMASDVPIGSFPSSEHGWAQLWVGPLAEEWWRVDLRGDPTMVRIGPDGPIGRAWRWTPLDGWQPDGGGR